MKMRNVFNRKGLADELAEVTQPNTAGIIALVEDAAVVEIRKALDKADRIVEKAIDEQLAAEIDREEAAAKESSRLRRLIDWRWSAGEEDIGVEVELGGTDLELGNDARLMPSHLSVRRSLQVVDDDDRALGVNDPVPLQTGGGVLRELANCVGSTILESASTAN